MSLAALRCASSYSFLDGFRDGRGVDAGVLRIDFPELRMVLDALVQARLRDGGIVHFAVAMPAIADQVDDHVGTKFGAIFRGQTAHADHGIGIFRVDVENRHALAARDARSEMRRVFLRRTRGEADQVVDDDVDRAADGVCGKVGKVQRFRPDALAGKGRIAVHHNAPNFVQSFRRAIDIAHRERRGAFAWRARVPWPQDRRLPGGWDSTRGER